MASLKLLTFNPTGIISQLKRQYLYSLLENYSIDLLALQEHWLLEKQFNVLSNLHSNYNCVAISGMNDTGEVILGRPYGGCAILWHNRINQHVTPINTSALASKRICAIKLQLHNKTVLIINMYLPCDSQRAQVPELESVLDEAMSLIHTSRCDETMAIGDMNCDISRDSAHVRCLKSFFSALSIKWACMKNDVDNDDFTYLDSNSLNTSYIDHFVVPDLFFDNIALCKPIHDGINTSGHSPVLLELNIPVEKLQLLDRQYVPKLAWDQASSLEKNMYANRLDELLQKIDLPHSVCTCSGLQCNCDLALIDGFAQKLVDECLCAAKQTISYRRENKSSRCIPGWNEYVKDALNTSRFWHSIWLQTGRPKHGIVANIMRSTRMKYHYAVRFVKKNEGELRNCRMAQTISDGDTRDFYKEVKKMLGSTKRVSATIDGSSDDKEIAGIFGDKFKCLYNSVGYLSSDMERLLRDIEADSSLPCCEEITVEDVRDAIRALKPGKSDGGAGLTSDHIINGCFRLCIYLCLLYNIMSRHSFVPTCMRVATIVPIPKAGTDMSCSANYRGIALASCLGKILDRIVLNKYDKYLHTSELQFGFKKGLSTDSCTMVLKETINYYVTESSNVYSVLIDASKAFDRIDFCKLFRKLLDRRMPRQVLIMLINLYTNQSIRATWNGVHGQFFTVSNGVRQGAVSSPTLFSIYMDGLLQRLEASKVGCYIGKLFVGALAYADDLTLLAPTVEACRKLLLICEKYAEEYSVQFNPSKSQFIIFGSNPIVAPKMYLCGQLIPLVQKVTHLGHIVSNSLNDNDDVIGKRAAFIGQVNFILNTFRMLKPQYLHKIFTIYCTSFYGSQLWKLNELALNPLLKSYNIALRKIFQLPYNSHRSILYSLANGSSLLDQLSNRTQAFIGRCLASTNRVVQVAANIGCRSARSTIGYNYVMLRLYNENRQNVSSEPGSDWIGEFCRELLDCRDGYGANGLSPEQNRVLLNFISSA